MDALFIGYRQSVQRVDRGIRSFEYQPILGEGGITWHGLGEVTDTQPSPGQG